MTTRLERWGFRAFLYLIQVRDRVRLWNQKRWNPGLEIHPTASSNFGSAEFELGPGSSLRIGAGVVTERRAGGVRFDIREGAHVEIEEGAWLRSDLGSVFLRAFPGARIRIGRGTQLNACMVSAKCEVDIGEKTMIGMGSRIFDADQHPIDADHPEVKLPVRIGDYVWLAADVTVLRGVSIGSHSVVGTRSLVRISIPPHMLASGDPAKLFRKVGDRSQVPF